MSKAKTGSRTKIDEAGAKGSAKNERDEVDRSVYAVTRGNDTKKCVRDAIDALGGIGKFVRNGDKVLVKVNICGGVPEIKGSYTSTVVAEEAGGFDQIRRRRAYFGRCRYDLDQVLAGC